MKKKGMPQLLDQRFATARNWKDGINYKDMKLNSSRKKKGTI
jgi:hypothetical protein